MLGEAAVTADQAARYMTDYEQAIRARRASAGRGVQAGPGISVKLRRCLRLSRAQIGRVAAELYRGLKALAVLARSLDIGLNIDAEEADRLRSRSTCWSGFCFEPELLGWHGNRLRRAG